MNMICSLDETNRNIIRVNQAWECINNSNEDINLGPFMKSENELKAEIGHRIDSKNLE